MSKITKDICKNVAPELRSQAETLADAVLTLQAKIIQQIPIYESEPLSQEVTVGTGETVLRQNPMPVEFRATVRDYASTLRALKEITGVEDITEPTQIAELKSQFKIAK